MNNGNDHGRGYTWASIRSTDRRWRRRSGTRRTQASRVRADDVSHGRLAGHGSARAGAAGRSFGQPMRTSAPRRYSGVISSRGTEGGWRPARRGPTALGWSSAGPGQLDAGEGGEDVGVAAGAVADGEHRRRAVRSHRLDQGPRSADRRRRSIGTAPVTHRGRAGKSAQNSSPRLASTTAATSPALAAVRMGQQLERGAADDRDVEGGGQGLGGGDPDPQPGEKPGADVDGDAADLLRTDAGHAGEGLDGRGQQLGVPAALPDVQGGQRAVGPRQRHARPGRWRWRCRAGVVIAAAADPLAADVAAIADRRQPTSAIGDPASGPPSGPRVRSLPLAVDVGEVKRMSRCSGPRAGAARSPHSMTATAPSSSISGRPRATMSDSASRRYTSTWISSTPNAVG